MSSKLSLFVATILLAAVSQVYAAEEKRTPVEEFKGATYYNLLMCQLNSDTVFLKVEMGLPLEEAYSTIGDCQKKGRADVKNLFPKANAQVAKKPAASKLLKEYFAIWLTAFNGITPDANELKTVYQRRRADADRKANEAWNRFEIEAGL